MVSADYASLIGRIFLRELATWNIFEAWEKWGPVCGNNKTGVTTHTCVMHFCLFLVCSETERRKKVRRELRNLGCQTHSCIFWNWSQIHKKEAATYILIQTSAPTVWTVSLKSDSTWSWNVWCCAELVSVWNSPPDTPATTPSITVWSVTHRTQRERDGPRTTPCVQLRELDVSQRHSAAVKVLLNPEMLFA